MVRLETVAQALGGFVLPGRKPRVNEISKAPTSSKFTRALPYPPLPSHPPGPCTFSASHPYAQTTSHLTPPQIASRHDHRSYNTTPHIVVPTTPQHNAPSPRRPTTPRTAIPHHTTKHHTTHGRQCGRQNGGQVIGPTGVSQAPFRFKPCEGRNGSDIYKRALVILLGNPPSHPGVGIPPGIARGSTGGSPGRSSGGSPGGSPREPPWKPRSGEEMQAVENVVENSMKKKKRRMARGVRRI